MLRYEALPEKALCSLANITVRFNETVATCWTAEDGHALVSFRQADAGCSPAASVLYLDEDNTQKLIEYLDVPWIVFMTREEDEEYVLYETRQ